MNVRTNTGHETGNVLLAVIIVVLALAGLAVAFVETGVQETKLATMSGERSRVGYIAETGINEAVGNLLIGGNGNLGDVANRVDFAGGEYVAQTVDNGDGTFTITAYAWLNHQQEAIEVVMAPEDVPLFSRALFGDLDLGASGNVFTDSYDSALGTYASQATNFHVPTGKTYGNANGHLGSNRNIFINGGVAIIGNATPGPGYTVQISGGSAYIEGSTAPALAPTLLPAIEYNPTVALAGAFSKSNDYTFSAGTYHFSDFTAKSQAKVTFQGDVVLYVDDSFDVSGQAELIVDANSTLVIYHSGDDFNLTGGGMINQDQKPSNFRLFSQASTVKFAGNSTFFGAVYAPSATITPVGTTDIYGSFVGRQIDVGGTTDFHYDEALGREAQNSRASLKRVSWRKVPPIL